MMDTFSSRTQLQPGVVAFADHSKHLRYRQNPEEHRRYFRPNLFERYLVDDRFPSRCRVRRIPAMKCLQDP